MKYLKDRLLSPEQAAGCVETGEVWRTRWEGVCLGAGGTLKTRVDTATTAAVRLGPGPKVGHLPQPRQLAVGVEDAQNQVGFLGGRALGEKEAIPLLTAKEMDNHLGE